MSLEQLRTEGGLRVVLPEDPDAFWNLEVAVYDWVWHTYTDLMYECANFVASLRGIEDVPYDGGEVIPVCGPIPPERLEALVVEWWERAVAADPRDS